MNGLCLLLLLVHTAGPFSGSLRLSSFTNSAKVKDSNVILNLKAAGLSNTITTLTKFSFSAIYIVVDLFGDSFNKTFEFERLLRIYLAKVLTKRLSSAALFMTSDFLLSKQQG